MIPSVTILTEPFGHLLIGPTNHETEVNPAEVLPKIHIDRFHRYVLFRNLWTGTDQDIAVSVLFGPGGETSVVEFVMNQFFIWGSGARRS